MIIYRKYFDYVIERFKEPSTWNAIGMAMIAFGINDTLSRTVEGFGILLTVVAGMLLPEGNA